jgi:hypothetical protein
MGPLVPFAHLGRNVWTQASAGLTVYGMPTPHHHHHSRVSVRRVAAAALLVSALGATAQATGALAATKVKATTTATTSTLTSTTSAVLQKASALLPRPTLSTPIVASLTPANQGVVLNNARDYVITIPDGTVFTQPVTIQGGHNVVIENSVLRYAAPAGAAADWMARGLYLTGQTGTMWVNNLQIRGPLSEGIDLAERAPGSTVVLRNIAVDPVSGTYETNHADVLQTWAGPDKLVVDGLTGTSNYQGMFLEPNDLFADGPKPTFFSLSNVKLDVSTGYYALWTDGYGAFPLATFNVSVVYNPAHPSRNSWLWPKPSTGDTTWNDVLGLKLL